MFTQAQLTKALRGARLFRTADGFAVAYRGAYIDFYPGTTLALVVTDFRDNELDCFGASDVHYVDDGAL
jgi:hypothetical protein